MEEQAHESAHLEAAKRTLEPEELARVLINTLRTSMTDPILELSTLVEQIEGEPALEMIHDMITESLVEARAGMIEMTDLADVALAGQPIEIVRNIDTFTRKDGTIETLDLSFIKLHSRAHQQDKVETLENATPEQVSRLLAQTIHEETVQGLTLVAGLPETPFLRRPGKPEPDPPRPNQLRAITNGFNAYTEQLKDLEVVTKKALKGEPVSISLNKQGKQTLRARAA